tara:strand:- start:134 stop:1156 length:1023 start_codon:yes stop_codon:yes gene_type:complete
MLDQDWKIFIGESNEWNKFVESNNGQFRQLYEWGNYKESLGWKVLRLVYEKDKKIISSTQIFYRKKFFLSMVYMPGGINGDFDYVSKKLISKIKNLIGANVIYLRADFINQFKDKDQILLKKNKWSRSKFEMDSRRFFEVDLCLTNDEILSNTSQKWRYNFKRSLKNNIVCKEETVNKNFFFTYIHNQLSKEKNMRNLFSDREVEALIKELNKKLIISTAWQGNKLIGVRSIILVGKKAWHLNSAVNLEGRKTLAGYKLLMHMIDVCKKRDVSYYNLGGVQEKLFPGPYQFKTSFGKKSSYQILGEWEFSNFLFMKFILNFAMQFYIKSSLLMSKIIKNL